MAITTKAEISNWLLAQNLTHFDFNDDLSVNVQQDVEIYLEWDEPSYYHFGPIALTQARLRRIPIRFSKIDGNFSVECCGLETLEGCPEIVTGTFDCASNELTSLEHGPKWVGESYLCGRNKLRTLEGAPGQIRDDFDAYRNCFESLKGSPTRVGGDFNCEESNLTNLIGAPEYVGKDFNCSWNEIETLSGLSAFIGGNLDASSNPLKEIGSIETVLEGNFIYGDRVGEYLENEVYVPPENILTSSFPNANFVDEEGHLETGDNFTQHVKIKNDKRLLEKQLSILLAPIPTRADTETVQPKIKRKMKI